MEDNRIATNNVRRWVQNVTSCFLGLAAILVLLPTMTVPSTPMYLFKADNPSVELFGGFPEVSFGAFGYCVDIVRSSTSDVSYPRSCSSILFGYDINSLEYSGPAGHKTFSISHLTWAQSSSAIGIYTRLMILYPFALALTVFSLISSLLPRERRHYGRAAAGSILAFLCVVLLVAFDFAALALVETHYIKHPINGNRAGRGNLGVGPITTIIAMVLLFMSSIWTSTFCCVDRARSKWRAETVVGGGGSSSDEFEKVDDAL